MFIIDTVNFNIPKTLILLPKCIYGLCEIFTKKNSESLHLSSVKDWYC
jgi:hypothetical protein